MKKEKIAQPQALCKTEKFCFSFERQRARSVPIAPCKTFRAEKEQKIWMLKFILDILKT